MAIRRKWSHAELIDSTKHPFEQFVGEPFFLGRITLGDDRRRVFAQVVGGGCCDGRTEGNFVVERFVDCLLFVHRSGFRFGGAIRQLPRHRRVRQIRLNNLGEERLSGLRYRSTTACSCDRCGLTIVGLPIVEVARAQRVRRLATLPGEEVGAAHHAVGVEIALCGRGDGCQREGVGAVAQLEINALLRKHGINHHVFKRTRDAAGRDQHFKLVANRRLETVPRENFEVDTVDQFDTAEVDHLIVAAGAIAGRGAAELELQRAAERLVLSGYGGRTEAGRVRAAVEHVFGVADAFYGESSSEDDPLAGRQRRTVADGRCPCC